MKNVKSLAALILIFIAVDNSYGQIKTTVIRPLKTKLQVNKLVGTWRLVEYSNFDSIKNQWEYPYGKNPKGYFTYTSNHIVSLNVSSEIPFHLPRDSAKSHLLDLYDYSWNYAFGYFGTYSIDHKNSIITHHVNGGTVPYFINTDQPRQFKLKGDTLIIGMGDFKKWRRVLVKAD
ncbi:MAG: hypothetical protein JWQ40_3952 [Segetibacter sp.]|nr:hypothetical protein [Segetibacter sp.]